MAENPLLSLCIDWVSTGCRLGVRRFYEGFHYLLGICTLTERYFRLHTMYSPFT